jgi:hypothetical protein
MCTLVRISRTARLKPMISRREYGHLSLVSVVCCQVDVSASGRSLIQRSSTERGLFSECEREAL